MLSIYNRNYQFREKKRTRPKSGSYLCWHYLSSRVGQCIVLPKKHSSGVFPAESVYAQKRTSRLAGSSFVLALPIFPGSRPPSIVGVHELNFCVRDGNRWTLMTINTNYGRWLLTILMSNSFSLSNRFRILAHLTVLVNPFFRILVTRTGFEPMLKA